MVYKFADAAQTQTCNNLLSLLPRANKTLPARQTIPADPNKTERTKRFFQILSGYKTDCKNKTDNKDIKVFDKRFAAYEIPLGCVVSIITLSVNSCKRFFNFFHRTKCSIQLTGLYVENILSCKSPKTEYTDYRQFILKNLSQEGMINT